jgi:hypothetical protein
MPKKQCEKFYNELKQSLLGLAISVSFDVVDGKSGENLSHYKVGGDGENIEKFKAILLNSHQFIKLCRGSERVFLGENPSSSCLFGSHALKQELVKHSILHDAVNNKIINPNEAKSYLQRADGVFLDMVYNADIPRLALDGQDETARQRTIANRFLNATSIAANTSIKKTGLELLATIYNTLSDQAGYEELKTDIRLEFSSASAQEQLKNISSLYPESKKHKQGALGGY